MNELRKVINEELKKKFGEHYLSSISRRQRREIERKVYELAKRKQLKKNEEQKKIQEDGRDRQG